MPGLIKKVGTVTVTVPANSTVVLTTPVDTIDWKQLDAQVDTIAITAGLTLGDLKFELTTALDKDEYPAWVALTGQTNVGITPGDSTYASWASGLRGWAAIRVVNSRASAITATLRVTFLYKERTT